MKKFLAASILAALLFPAAASCAPVEIDRIAAIVGQQVITVSELQGEMAPALAELGQRYRGDQLAQAVDRLKRSKLNDLIDKYLQIQEAKLLGVEVEGSEVDAAIEDIMKNNGLDKQGFVAALEGEGYTFEDYKKVLNDQLMIMRLVTREIKSKISVTEEEITGYYDKEKSRFSLPETIKVANISFPAKGGDMDTALKNAQDARAKIMAGTPFEEMAATCTGDPDAAKTCVLGTFSKGELSKDVEDKAFRMAAGEVSEPIRGEKGYQLIKVMEHTQGGAKGLEEARQDIVGELTSKKGEALFAAWLQELRKRSYVEIRDLTF